MSPYIDSYGVEQLLSCYKEGVYVPLITILEVDKAHNVDQLKSMLNSSEGTKRVDGCLNHRWLDLVLGKVIKSLHRINY